MMKTFSHKHLLYFREVARDGNLTRTAKRLAVAQSALSTQIQMLEQRLGHDLFERSGRQLVLTEAGRLTLDYANAIFSASEDLVAALNAGSGRRRPLRVGALATLSRNFQIDFLRPSLGRPDLEVILTSGSMGELVELLKRLDLDVVLCNAPTMAGRDDNLVTHRLAQQTISLFGSPALGIVGDDLPQIIGTAPLILPTGTSSIRTEFDALCQQFGVSPNVVAEVDDMAMLRLMAREGIGLAPLPAIVVRDELEAGVLAEIVPLPDIREAFYALTVNRQFGNPAATELIKIASGLHD